MDIRDYNIRDNNVRDNNKLVQNSEGFFIQNKQHYYFPLIKYILFIYRFPVIKWKNITFKNKARYF